MHDLRAARARVDEIRDQIADLQNELHDAMAAVAAIVDADMEERGLMSDNVLDRLKTQSRAQRVLSLAEYRKREIAAVVVPFRQAAE
jgi:outer membrane protein TolC